MSPKKQGPSEKTIKVYTDCLKRLDKHEINYKNPKSILNLVTEIQKIKGKSNSDNLSASALRTYLSSIVWFYKQANMNEELIHLLNKRIRSINSIKTKEYDENKLNDKELKSFIPWPQVLEVYDTLYASRYNSQLQFKKCITIALYVLFPPRRLADYSHMICVANDENLDDTKNYYVMQPKGKFIFNEYKTKQKYGSQKFIISVKLNKLLTEYVTKYDLINKELIGISEIDLTKKIKRTFKKFTDQNVTVNTLRHSFISYLVSQNKLQITKQRKNLSIKMAHSHVIQQDIYYKTQ